MLAITCSGATQIASSQAAPTASVSPPPAASAYTPLRGKPYSAKRTMTRVQYVPDGTTVTHIHQQLIWRDAEGRERQDDVQISPNPFGEIHQVNVWDPVEQRHMSWVTGESLDHRIMDEVHVTHPEQDAAKDVLRKQQPINQQPILHPCSATANSQREIPCFISESLPPLYIDGVSARGERVTEVIPAGAEGNDHEITVIQDHWTSSDLGITIRSIRDDPRVGKTTVELTAINRLAPDPVLFQPPVGWRLRNDSPKSPAPSVPMH